MGHYAIGVIVLLAGGLGLAYVAMDPFAFDDAPLEQVIVPAEQADDQAATASEPRPAVKGSAARLMDDFGSGPSGTTITVPLRDRHRQAYAGSGTGGGGGTGKATAGSDVETAALPTEDTAVDADAEAPAFRVIEREIEEPLSTETETETESEGDVSPSFDVVRVDPTGRTVMAGRAAPLTDVEVKVGSEVVDRVTASPTGEWVSTPSEPLGSGDQELSLTAVGEGDEPVESRQVVVVSVPQSPSGTEQPVAVVLDKEEGGEGRILQAPDQLQSADDGRLALKLVDYDDEGAIKISGEAPPGAPVRIYVDNEPAALVIGDSKGYWIATLDRELPGGDYTLRLDQLDPDGQTVARLETPFTRVTKPPVEGQVKVDYVVVQPGNSLWRIARRLSGDGFNYVDIYQANQAQIRDPDKIYPGQVFEVPPGPG